MWVLPDTEGLPPGYEQRAVGEALATGELVPVASGKGHDGAITIHQKDAVLWVGRLAAGKTVTVPDAPHAHVYVARGSVTLDGAGDLAEGDAARLTDAGAASLTAGPDGSEVIIWETA
jgi:redox-sensitive bicupin YhaK (pirin superfamily)